MKTIIQYIACALLSLPYTLTGQVKPNPGASLSGITPVNTLTLPQAYSSGLPLNYVRTWEPQVPVTNAGSVDEHMNPNYTKMHSLYADGFGRKVQDIIRNHGDAADLVRVYDNRDGATTPDFLPYSAASNSRFQFNAFSLQKAYYDSRFPNEGSLSYSLLKYTSNPVSRTVKECEPGKSLAGQDIGTTTSNTLNEADEVALIVVNESSGLPQKIGYYGAGKLLKKVSTKEHGGLVEAFYDNTDRLVCKRILQGYNYSNGAATAIKNSTFPVYDEFGRLRFTISPKAYAWLTANNWNVTAAVVEQLCDYSLYDSLDRVVETHIAGKTGNNYLVYDSKNRVCMTQSPKLRQLGKWAFTLYDGQDRLKMTGILRHPGNRQLWQDVMSGTGFRMNEYPGMFEYYAAYHHDPDAYPSYILSAPPSGYDTALLTSYTYYENYTNPFFSGHQYLSSIYSGNLSTMPAALAPQQNALTRGLITGTRTRVIKANGTDFNTLGDWINTINYYDDYGRVIQAEIQSQVHNANAWDRIGYQYSFAGQKLREIYKHRNSLSPNKPATTFIKSYSYHPRNFKLQTVSMAIDNEATRTVFSYSYDELGRIRQKSIGGIETQTLDYNIRNQLVGINRGYVLNGTAGNCTFGEILSYDYGFTNPRYDGNIAGMIWRGAGTSPMKAYGYTYGFDGRLSSGDYTQYNAQLNTWTNTEADYSEKNIAYDENGNIKALTRMGRTTVLTGYPTPAMIDNLTYSYAANEGSNRLLNITDQVVQNNLTDYDVKDNVTVADFEYDDEGNCTRDNNRKITTTYNYLNRPEKLEFANGGRITYAYDASGNKLAEYYNLSGQQYRLDYVGAFVYRNDSLQHINHDEGNARYTNTGFKYQYFVKDHEGNVRNVLEAVESLYPKDYFADHELASASVEQMIFDRIPEVRDDKPDSNNPADQKAAELDADDPAKRIGTSLLLHVMAGDKFSLEAQSFYEGRMNQNETINPPDMLGSVIATLTGGVGGFSGSEGGKSTAIINRLFDPANYLEVYQSIKDGMTDPTVPRAYLNYLVFDEDMRMVPEQSGAIQVGAAAGSWQTLGSAEQIEITRDGYLAVYISNETSGLKVYMDKIRLSYYKGNLVDENHYYPYGLTINLSTANALPNCYLFMGNKLEKTNNLHIYDFNAREYDPQIARFLSVDPLKEYFGGYNYAAGDPISISDKTGLKGSGSVWTSYGSGSPSAATNMLWNTTGRYYGGSSVNIDPDFKKGVDKGYQKMTSQVVVAGAGMALGGLTSGEAAYVAASRKRAAEVAAESMGTRMSARMSAESGMSRSVAYRTAGQSTASGFAKGELTPGMGSMAMESGQAKAYASKAPVMLSRVQAADVTTNTFSPIVRASTANTELTGISSVSNATGVAAEGGTNLVYHGLDAAGTVKYVGITERAAGVRFAEHLNSETAKSLLDFEIIPGATGLTRTQARVWEQTLINQYGLEKNGGMLLNKINSIAPINWWQYGIK